MIDFSENYHHQHHGGTMLHILMIDSYVIKSNTLSWYMCIGIARVSADLFFLYLRSAVVQNQCKRCTFLPVLRRVSSDRVLHEVLHVHCACKVYEC